MTGPPALLALEDGTVFRGTGFGAEGEAFGEAVFNTGMAGYQEVLSDPSYAGQIVAMTAPQQGNYGVNRDDAESARVQVSGFVVREASRRTSSWRADGSLTDELLAANVVGIEGIDTRRLTLRLRDHGAMRAAISTLDQDAASLVARVQASPAMEGADLARTVSAAEPYEAAASVGPADASLGAVFRVAAYDYGMKRNILRRLAVMGCETTVFPAETPPAEIAAGGFDGVFLSNGPGDPAVTAYGIAAVRGPDRQGADLRDLPGPSAARAGARRPDVQDAVRASRCEPAREEPPDGRRRDHQPQPRLRGGSPGLAAHRWRRSRWAETDHGPAELTHWNLNDGTLEGLRCVDVPAFSVQYHPEAAPGPHDSRYLFQDFRDLMEHA